MGNGRKNSNHSEVQKKTFLPLLDDLPSDTQALVAIIESLGGTIGDLTSKIAELTDLVASLREELKRIKSAKSNDSSNSGLPPSASNPSKSTGNLSPKKVDKNRSLRKMTQEKPGRLPGHEGSGMKLKEVSDRIVDIFPEECTGCKNLEFCRKNGRVCDKRYTKDIQFKVEQTEYRNWEFQCPNKSNQIVQGTFPHDVTGTKQYGENIKSFVILQRTIGFVSFNRIAKLCSSLGFDFSTGTLHSIYKSYAGKCKNVKSLITLLLQSSPVLGMDEIGGNVNGKKVWHHTTVSDDATLIVAHKNRGGEGTLSAGVMQDFTGVVEHDFWKPYFLLEHVTHAMCAAHLEREDNKAQTDNPKCKWPTLMNDLFHELERLRKEFLLLGLDRIPEDVLLPYLDRYDDILKTGAIEDPIPLVGKKLKKNGEPRKPALSKAQNLLKRYRKYKEEILRFTTDFAVPVSNNFSERSFRFLKVAYNVFGCFRTFEGAAEFSMVNSVLDTGRKQGLSPKDIVSRVFNENYLGIFNDECREILMANGATPTLT